MYGLEELKSIPKFVEISQSECDMLGEMKEYSKKYHCSIGEKDGHYYLFEKSETDDYDTAREVALADDSHGYERFEFTTDDMHIWFAEINSKTKIMSAPEARELDKSLIEEGMSCTFRGVTLTYNNHNSVTIESGGKSRTMKVEDDSEFVYKFMKTKIKAKYGAEGLYSHMEQVAEQSKIETRPFWTSSYEMLERVLTDPKLQPKNQYER